jgi:hypothetical protein
MKTKAKKTVTSTAVPTATPAPTAPVAEPKPYAVLADKQGIGYLRVAFTKLGAQAILNTGKEVALVSLDAKTIKSRALAPVPGMDTAEEVLKSARLLAHPLTANIKVQPSAQKVLNSILEDKELIEMASKKKAEKKAPKVKAAAKAKAGRAPSNSVITLLKAPEEGQLRGQALAICGLLKKGKGIAKAELIEAIGKAIPSKNKLGAADLWSMNRRKLIDGGFVAEAAAA